MKYFQIIAEMDFIHWQLTEWIKERDKLSPIKRMIDEATGYDKQQEKEAIKLGKRFKKLKKIIDKYES